MKISHLYNQLLNENTEKISPKFIYQYINKLHKNGWEKSSFKDPEWVNDHQYFVLIDLLLDDNRLKNLNKAPIYVKETGEYPPIVIGANGYVIDGMHRVESAKKRGDTIIKAYIGF